MSLTVPDTEPWCLVSNDGLREETFSSQKREAVGANDLLDWINLRRKMLAACSDNLTIYLPDIEHPLLVASNPSTCSR